MNALVDRAMSSPETWRLILGPAPLTEDVRTASAAWQAMPWPYKANFLERHVVRIELLRDLSEISITFNSEVSSPFAPSQR